ncbi:uncharacterized protein LOC144656606 [Oculina patagonica]
MALLKPFPVLVTFLTFLLYAALTEQQIVRDFANGISSANFVKHDKSRLDTEKLASVTAKLSTECGGKCLLSETCSSVNYGGIGGHECQLLAANKFDSSEKMTVDKNFQHFSVVSPCDKKPCLNGGKCLPIYEQDSYRCQCPRQINVQKSCEDGRTLPSPDGNWTAFWWYDIDTTWPSGENDVLAYNFSHCRSSDPYCFERLPSDAIEDSTELLAIDSERTEYKWSFDSGNPVAHAAWRAFHDHQIIPYWEVKDATPAWNPEVLNGAGPRRGQDSFMYREQNGVRSVMLDDDNCDCYTTLSLGHGMCTQTHRGNLSPADQFGVDTLYEASCVFGVQNGPRPGVGLTLYFRTKP